MGIIQNEVNAFVFTICNWKLIRNEWKLMDNGPVALIYSDDICRLGLRWLHLMRK